MFTAVLLLCRVITVNMALRGMLPFGELVPEEASSLKLWIIIVSMPYCYLIPVHHLYVMFVYVPMTVLGNLFIKNAFDELNGQLGDLDKINTYGLHHSQVLAFTGLLVLAAYLN